MQTVLLLLARLLMLRGQLPAFSEQDNPAAFASNRKARFVGRTFLTFVLHCVTCKCCTCDDIRVNKLHRTPWESLGTT